MICEQWIEENKKGGSRGLIEVILRSLLGVTEENKETFVRVTDVQAEIWSWHVKNASAECYRYINLLAVVVHGDILTQSDCVNTKVARF